MRDLHGRVLAVTGANGFVGLHVVRSAAARGATVLAIAREPEPASSLAEVCADYFRADLEYEWPKIDKVDAIVHLAGLAAVGPSFAQPQRYLNVNSAIMTTMCEALLSSESRARVVVASSGSVYAPGPTPIEETSPTRPSSPYAVAKLLVESQASYYVNRGIDVVVMRPFNHIGPGQSNGFLVPDLTSALESLPSGESLRVGNLDVERDFTDVRDVAAAYLTIAYAAEHRHALYNVASGKTRSGGEILGAVVEAMGRSLPTLAVDPARLRPNDPPRIQGSATRMQEEFGWKPRINWRQSIADFVSSRATG